MKIDLLKFVLFAMSMMPTLQSPAIAQDPAQVLSADAALRLEAVIQGELDRHFIHGVSVALIDGERILYARGFGFSHSDAKIPATAESIYRAGSISKLLTAVAAMRLGEAERLDIDAPAQTWLPEFRIINPYRAAPTITLRQLMSHRSGMVREAPVGGYFDDHEPSLDATVFSVADCVLPSAPEAKTRYSNVGPTIVGKAIETVSGESFDDFVQKHVFDIVGMPSSSWKLKESQRDRMSMGYMSVAQPQGGFRKIAAPRFELGTVPAGNLYTTVEDLGRFVMFLINQGRVGERVLLKPETLAEMYRPQGSNATRTFGLGFGLGKFQENETVFHMGAVYGFTSSLVAIPSKRVGAVVLANEDLAAGSVQRIMIAALEAVLADHQPLSSDQKESPGNAPERPTASGSSAIVRNDLQQFAGKYESDSYWAEITEKEGQLHAVISGQPMLLESKGELEFVSNGRFAFESITLFERNAAGEVGGFKARGEKFTRLSDSREDIAPENWSKFVGSYGPEFIPLIISIRNGHLYAMTENEMDYRLTPMNRFVFRLPPGMYEDEQIVFQATEEGHVHSVVMANFVLKRASPPQPE